MHFTRFTLLLALSLGSFAGCASEEAAADWRLADSTDATDSTAQDLSIGGGGSGYTCDASWCSCTPLVDCEGMNDDCFERGKTITCTYPPDATPECHCDLTVHRTMKTLAFALCTAAALLSACASEDEAASWESADGDLASQETADEALSLGGDLGYSCSTTSCSCTPTSPDTSADTCRGALDACHDRGWTLVCVWKPDGTASCTCDAGTGSRLVVRTGVASGGTVVRAR